MAEKPPVLPPMKLLTQVAAAHYLNCSRNTIAKLVKEDKLSTVDHDGKTFYRVRDLDKARAFLGKYQGKRGRPHDTERAFNKDHNKEALEKQELLADGMFEAMGIDPSMGEREAEALLRKQIMLLAQRNKVVQRIFALLDSPSEQTQLKALQMVREIVLPARKEVTHSADETWKETIQQMEDLRDSVKRDIAFLTGPR